MKKLIYSFPIVVMKFHKFSNLKITNLESCNSNKASALSGVSRAEVLNLPNAGILNSVPPAVVTPEIKLFSLLLHNCNFAIVMK